MKIPVFLPTVHVQVTESGVLHVDVDGEPHDTEGPLSRGKLSDVLDQITTALDSPVRVEVTESDKTTYADIATPPVREPVLAQRHATRVDAPGINGTGFQPGEEIAIAYVIAHQTADGDGSTALHLPPALLAVKREGFVLLGMTSQVIASVD
ncbi:hypothetical protein [Nocardioides sp.]|uniref:hypothetical protein n=1 Tax=Nocardioides sp. TaxID=35761 RepID=UPI002C83F305|nr:hypothetical protein [Nocardioides sp.]HXH78382.1 hypothetical protein [Nocardioides sp.]